MDFFFFNDTATTEIYTLSLHDALPIFQLLTDVIHKQNVLVLKQLMDKQFQAAQSFTVNAVHISILVLTLVVRSEEHTSELQSRQYLVCRLLLEKKYVDSMSLAVCHPLS